MWLTVLLYRSRIWPRDLHILGLTQCFKKILPNLCLSFLPFLHPFQTLLHVLHVCKLNQMSWTSYRPFIAFYYTSCLSLHISAFLKTFWREASLFVGLVKIFPFKLLWSKVGFQLTGTDIHHKVCEGTVSVFHWQNTNAWDFSPCSCPFAAQCSCFLPGVCSMLEWCLQCCNPEIFSQKHCPSLYYPRIWAEFDMAWHDSSFRSPLMEFPSQSSLFGTIYLTI